MSGSLCLTSFIHPLFLQPILVSRHCAHARHIVMGKTWPSPGPHGGMSGRRGNCSLENNQTSKGKCIYVPTNINTLTKRLMVLRPGTQLMGLWVPHTVGAQTDHAQRQLQKSSPARRQGCASRPAVEAGAVFLICAAKMLSDFTGECGPGDRLQKRPDPFHSGEKTLNSPCERCA